VSPVELSYTTEGDGALVVLLHGFPEFRYSWRKQIPALAAAGFQVVAPDLRGYNPPPNPERCRTTRSWRSWATWRR
jgi:pimeloyl-ACP methyl ester carboxylesterase